jgi:tetratricopeptide (TPR) repeat protein
LKPADRARAEARTPEPEPSRPRPWIVLAAVLAAVAASYSNALQVPFMWDDLILVQQEPLVRRLSPAAHLTESFWRKGASDHGNREYYRPVTTWSLALDQARSGGRPGPFHATNVALHLAVCAFVFALARRAGAPTVAAGLAAAAFGVFPRLTECVTWTSGRTDVLAGLFALLALLVHASGERQLARRGLAAGALLLGLLSKEVAVAALCGLAALEASRAARGDQRWRRAALNLAPALVATGVYAALRIAALGHAMSRAEPVRGGPWVGVAMPIQALGQYALMLLDPLRPRLRIGTFGAVQPAVLAVGAVAAAGLFAGVVAAVWRPPRPWVSAALATSLAALALVLHLVPIRLGTVAADRFLYVPLAGLTITAAALAAALHGRRARIAAALAAVGVATFGIATAQRNEVWGDEVRFWQAALDGAAPGDVLPMNELATALARANRVEEAAALFDRLAAMTTGWMRRDSLANAATALSDLGRLEEARARLELVIQAEPSRPLHRFNLAVLEARLLRFDAADAQLGRALELFPEYGDALNAREQFGEIRRLFAALPPESNGEPTSIRARRAALFSRLGVRTRAGPLWRAVAAAPDASADELTQAAAFLASNGTRSEAEAALARARSAGAQEKVLSGIQAVLDGRAAR